VNAIAWKQENPFRSTARIDNCRFVLLVHKRQDEATWRAACVGVSGSVVNGSGFASEAEARAWCERKVAEAIPPPPPVADPSPSSLTWHATPRGTLEASKPTERGPYVFKVTKVRAGSW
jgi:hypothetical protein